MANTRKNIFLLFNHGRQGHQQFLDLATEMLSFVGGMSDKSDAFHTLARLKRVCKDTNTLATSIEKYIVNPLLKQTRKRLINMAMKNEEIAHLIINNKSLLNHLRIHDYNSGNTIIANELYSGNSYLESFRKKSITKNEYSGFTLFMLCNRWDSIRQAVLNSSRNDLCLMNKLSPELREKLQPSLNRNTFLSTGSI